MVTDEHKGEDGKTLTEHEVLERAKQKEKKRDEEKVQRLNELQQKVNEEAKLKRTIATEISAIREERMQASSQIGDAMTMMAMAMMSKHLGPEAAPLVARLVESLSVRAPLRPAHDPLPSREPCRSSNSTPPASGLRLRLNEDDECPPLKRRLVPLAEKAKEPEKEEEDDDIIPILTEEKEKEETDDALNEVRTRRDRPVVPHRRNVIDD